MRRSAGAKCEEGAREALRTAGKLGKIPRRAAPPALRDELPRRAPAPWAWGADGVPEVVDFLGVLLRGGGGGGAAPPACTKCRAGKAGGERKGRRPRIRTRGDKTGAEEGGKGRTTTRGGKRGGRLGALVCGGIDNSRRRENLDESTGEEDKCTSVRFWQPSVQGAFAFWFFGVGSSRTNYAQTTNKLRTNYALRDYGLSILSLGDMFLFTMELRTNYKQTTNKVRTCYEQTTNKLAGRGARAHRRSAHIDAEKLPRR